MSIIITEMGMATRVAARDLLVESVHKVPVVGQSRQPSVIAALLGLFEHLDVSDGDCRVAGDIWISLLHVLGKVARRS